MPLKVIIGDLLTCRTDAIVIPLVPFSGPSSKYSRMTYEQAGCEELLLARQALPKMNDGECGMTEGFGLFADYVFHARVPEWFGGLEQEHRPLSKCYCNALRIAAGNGIQSIAFPLLGVGTNRVPPRTAFIIARDALNGYIHAHDLALTAYLVIHPSVIEEVEDLCDHISCTQEVSETTSPNPEIPPLEKFKTYINRIDNASKIAKLMGCSTSTVTRIRNHEYKGVPQKSTILQLAIALGLTKAERYEFVNCVHPPYPFDERDEVLEQLLAQGYKKLTDIDIELEKRNPEWVLIHKSKGDILPNSERKITKKEQERNP